MKSGTEHMISKLEIIFETVSSSALKSSIVNNFPSGFALILMSYSSLQVPSQLNLKY